MAVRRASVARWDGDGGFGTGWRARRRC